MRSRLPSCANKPVYSKFSTGELEERRRIKGDGPPSKNSTALKTLDRTPALRVIGRVQARVFALRAVTLAATMCGLFAKLCFVESSLNLPGARQPGVAVPVLRGPGRRVAALHARHRRRHAVVDLLPDVLLHGPRVPPPPLRGGARRRPASATTFERCRPGNP